MIKEIKWKVKQCSKDSFQPGIKYIKLKITLSKTGNEYWDSYLQSQIDKGDFIEIENGAVYREYTELNPVTLAILGYLEQLTHNDNLGRFDNATQIIRCIDTLHRFWD